MGRQNGQTTEETQKLSEDWKSLREISKILGRSHSTLKYIFKTIKDFKTNKTKKAHNKLFNEAEERNIVRACKRDPLHALQKACPQTIRIIL